MRFIKVGKTLVNMDKIEVITNLEGEGEVTLRLESGTSFKIANEAAKALRSALLGDDESKLMDDDYECDCERCSALKDALIEALLELEPSSKTIQ